MSFLTDAQESLTEEQYAKLKSLQQKSSEFEATPQEEHELMELKTIVRNAIAQRDRVKNLAFLNGKTYSLADLFKAGGYSKEDWSTAAKELFPTVRKDAVEVAVYKVGTEDVSVKMFSEDRITKDLAAAIKKGGAKGFIANARNLEWLVKNHEGTVGLSAGKIVYDNLPAVLMRLKLKEHQDAIIKGLEERFKKEKPAEKAEQPATQE